MELPSRIDKRKLKAEIIRKVWKMKPKPYEHNFTMASERCGKCSTKFWEWAVYDEKGISVKSTVCPVIGMEEVEGFRNNEW